MNRVIKFRVWDKEDKRMHICGENIHDSISFDDDNIGEYYNLQNGCGSPETYELMQYTGLKDKNCVEIYEGDIVKQTYYKSVGYGEDIENYEGWFIGEVVIISSGVCMKKPLMYECEMDKLVKTNGYKNIAGYRSEVIGNIYENPELLKESGE